MIVHLWTITINSISFGLDFGVSLCAPGNGRRLCLHSLSSAPLLICRIRFLLDHCGKEKQHSLDFGTFGALCHTFVHISPIRLIGEPSQSSSAISLFGSVFQFLLGKTRGISMSDKTNIQEPPQCVLGLTVSFSLRECGSKKTNKPQSGGNLAGYLKRSGKSISTTQTALWRLMDL